MKLLDHHKEVLRALVQADEDCGERYFMNFRTISGWCAVKDVRKVRRIVRHLARRGLTEYKSGLWNDDGEMAGSGYRITKAGERALEAA